MQTRVTYKVGVVNWPFENNFGPKTSIFIEIHTYWLMIQNTQQKETEKKRKWARTVETIVIELEWMSWNTATYSHVHTWKMLEQINGFRIHEKKKVKRPEFCLFWWVGTLIDGYSPHGFEFEKKNVLSFFQITYWSNWICKAILIL